MRRAARAYEHNAEFSAGAGKRAWAFYGSRGRAAAGIRDPARARRDNAEVKHVMIENIDKVRVLGTELGGSKGSATCTIVAGGIVSL